MNFAKEKADELFNKYYQLSAYSAYPYNMAKQCSLLAVVELIKYGKTFGDVTELDIQHFEDIKKEIELL